MADEPSSSPGPDQHQPCGDAGKVDDATVSMGDDEDAAALQQQQHDDVIVDVADDDATVSMVDVLADERQLQEDAAAVLGACDDSVCTYPQV